MEAGPLSILWLIDEDLVLMVPDIFHFIFYLHLGLNENSIQVKALLQHAFGH